MTWIALAALVWMGGGFIAAVQGPYSEDSPGHLNLIYRLDLEQQEAVLVADCMGGSLPVGMGQVGGFGPLRDGQARSAAEVLPLPAPAFQVDGIRKTGSLDWEVSGRLLPGAKARMVTVQVQGPVKHCQASLDGVVISDQRLVGMVGIPQEGLDFELKLTLGPFEPSQSRAVRLAVRAEYSGLPERFAEVAAARPADKVAFGRGDRVEVLAVPIELEGLGKGGQEPFPEEPSEPLPVPEGGGR